MRKVLDVMTVVSFLVSATVVGGGVYLYTQKDVLVERARERATEAITEAVTGALAGGLTGGLSGGSILHPLRLQVQDCHCLSK